MDRSLIVIINNTYTAIVQRINRPTVKCSEMLSVFKRKRGGKINEVIIITCTQNFAGNRFNRRTWSKQLKN